VEAASDGPYAKHLHLPPDTSHCYLTIHFLQARCSSWCPTVSKDWRQMPSVSI